MVVKMKALGNLVFSGQRGPRRQELATADHRMFPPFASKLQCK
jgi:hypothetical protein